MNSSFTYHWADGVNWQLANVQKMPKFNQQLTFLARLTDIWQKALAIVFRLKFTENNFWCLKYCYNLTFFFQFKYSCRLKLCLDRSDHAEFCTKSVNINYCWLVTSGPNLLNMRFRANDCAPRLYTAVSRKVVAQTEKSLRDNVESFYG